MNDDRRKGSLLLLTSTVVFTASAQDLIPAVAFFIGIGLAPFGAFLFMKGNRQAAEDFERRLNPVLKNEAALKNAGNQALRNLDLDARRRHVAHSVTENQVLDGELLLCDISESLEIAEEKEGDYNMKIEPDVSFPVEVQERSSLADQLEKIRRLAADGVLSQEEFEAAKTRILS